MPGAITLNPPLETQVYKSAAVTTTEVPTTTLATTTTIKEANMASAIATGLIAALVVSCCCAFCIVLVCTLRRPKYGTKIAHAENDQVLAIGYEPEREPDTGDNLALVAYTSNQGSTTQ